MKGEHPPLDNVDQETLPPCDATRARTRTLLEQLGDLGRLPKRIKSPVTPTR